MPVLRLSTLFNGCNPFGTHLAGTRGQSLLLPRRSHVQARMSREHFARDIFAMPSSRSVGELALCYCIGMRYFCIAILYAGRAWLCVD